MEVASVQRNVRIGRFESGRNYAGPQLLNTDTVVLTWLLAILSSRAHVYHFKSYDVELVSAHFIWRRCYT